MIIRDLKKSSNWKHIQKIKSTQLEKQKAVRKYTIKRSQDFFYFKKSVIASERLFNSASIGQEQDAIML